MQFLQHIIIWISKRLNHKQQMYILSLLIGIVSGLAAVLLKNTVHYTHQLVSQHENSPWINFLYLAMPMLGILLTALYVRFIVKDEMGHGITKILHSISKKGGYLRPLYPYSGK